MSVAHGRCVRGTTTDVDFVYEERVRAEDAKAVVVTGEEPDGQENLFVLCEMLSWDQRERE